MGWEEQLASAVRVNLQAEQSESYNGTEEAGQAARVFELLVFSRRAFVVQLSPRAAASRSVPCLWLVVCQASFSRGHSVPNDGGRRRFPVLVRNLYRLEKFPVQRI